MVFGVTIHMDKMADVKADEYIIPHSPDHCIEAQHETNLSTLKEESLSKSEDSGSVNFKNISQVEYDMTKRELHGTQTEKFSVIANVSSQLKPELEGTEGTQAVQPQLITHHSSSQYQCTTCDESFKSLLKLKDHMKQHYGQPTLKCQVCGLMFVRMSTLHEHMRVHSNPPVKLSEQQTNTDHVPVTDVTDLPHRCHDCNAQFRGKFDLVAHLDTVHCKHMGECYVCGKLLPSALRLKKHMRVMHPDHWPYICRKCGCKFSHKDTWRRHEMKQCENAPGNTGTNTTFGSSHLLAICKVCAEEFTSMADLDAHMITMHPGKHCFDCRKIGGQLVLEGSVELANESVEEQLGEDEEEEDDVEEEEYYSHNGYPDPSSPLEDSDQNNPIPMCIYRNEGTNQVPVPLVMWSTTSSTEGNSSILCDDGAEDLILP